MSKKNEKNDNILYELSVGSSIGTSRIINHCKPLLQGYKYYQMAIFIQNSKVFQDLVKGLFLPLKT
jgi:hypothetical protein